MIRTALLFLLGSCADYTYQVKGTPRHEVLDGDALPTWATQLRYQIVCESDALRSLCPHESIGHALATLGPGWSISEGAPIDAADALNLTIEVKHRALGVGMEIFVNATRGLATTIMPATQIGTAFVSERPHWITDTRSRATG